jgi:hypothetical protein
MKLPAFLRRQSKPGRLIVMRLAEMVRVHPDQVIRKCDVCREDCGINPSGQAAIRRDPGMEVVCNHCHSTWGTID